MFPEAYHSRHKLEKKQKHKLPPLPGEAITIDNRYGQNMLATWSAVCGIVLLMMFVFCVFASLVGFVLWYMMEVVLDVAGELMMEISDLFSFSWQALIILYLEGQMPHNIQEVMSGCLSRILGTLTRLVDRTKVFFTEGEVTPPPPVTIYISDPQIHFSNHTQVLTKVAQADLVNYVFLAGLVTYLFYRIGRYLQNMNANVAQAR
ncbi:hypothetical protein LSH36_510g03064 [Paralvinella palmiformis]|uniref:Uncharacterized protein n=1 Tax=Paralvinella palmiformis TaxID=53620 RepID=A0AAD9J7S9_9ANNE|nr:hypothetical protein LSH36_510g03064 [Paralvinella palmiformis]